MIWGMSIFRGPRTDRLLSTIILAERLKDFCYHLTSNRSSFSKVGLIGQIGCSVLSIAP